MNRSSLGPSNRPLAVITQGLVTLVSLALLSGACSDDPKSSNNGGNADVGNDVVITDDTGISTVLSISRVEPTMGNVAGGTNVGLQGTGFQPEMEVSFGGKLGTQLQIISFQQATIVTPAGDLPGAVTVRLDLPDGQTASLPNAFTYVEAIDPSVDFCQLQAQSPASGVAGTAIDPLFAIVFAAGVTEGEGQGPTVEGELGWGTDDDYENFQFVSMGYNLDKDGLNPGDLANDEYGAAPTLQVAGTYRYVARFRLTTQNTVTWTYCDLDGSDNGIDSAQLGTIEVTNPVLPTVGFCQLQSPGSTTVETGQLTDPLRAIVYSDGITNSAGHGAALVGELGWGPVGASETTFDYRTMNYSADVDGLSAGDLANDEYGARLQIGAAGSYRYAARFALAADPTNWVYCDLDGSDNGIDAAQLGTIDVSDPAVPTVGFCQTESTSASAQTGMPTGALAGVVFVAGSTQGAGQGGGVTAEVVWGPASSDYTTWTDTVTATYVGDADGLSAGDQANDRYEAALTAPSAGDYAFVFRFSADGGSTWSYCDTDGSDGTLAGFDALASGALSVVDTIVELPDACNLQYPELEYAAAVGTPIRVFGRVTEAGITGQGSANASVAGELVVGPSNADPIADAASFDTVAAAFNPNTIGLGPDEDEYEATWTPSAPGSYQFLYRFSVDAGQNWAYCDLSSTSPGGAHSSDRVGIIEAQGAPDPIDFCHVWQTSLSATSTDNAPLVTVEVYDAAITDGNGGANSGMIEAEVGYGTDGNNPGVDGAYAWSAMAYKGLRAGFDNNYEYEGPAYSGTLSVGLYDVAVRVRSVGTTDWTYCDTDESASDFRSAVTTSLEITP